MIDAAIPFADYASLGGWVAFALFMAYFSFTAVKQNTEAINRHTEASNKNLELLKELKEVIQKWKK